MLLSSFEPHREDLGRRGLSAVLPVELKVRERLVDRFRLCKLFSRLSLSTTLSEPASTLFSSMRTTSAVVETFRAAVPR